MLHASDSFPSHWVLFAEVALVALGLALAARGSPVLAAGGRLLARTLRRAARRPAPALAVLAAGTAAVLALHTALAGVPLPRVVDEWSYLLAADTFAQNRLANPPHPLWRHFEADHVLQQPTYASKYPPAQGVALALGQVAFGRPVAGLWLSAALLVAASGWMLLAWVPGRWAILGALLVALRLAAGSYWGHSYWGGAVAAIGGCLLLGAARRLFRRVRVADAVALAAGLAILATSRPYEGLLTTLPVAVLLAGGLATRRLAPSPWLRLVLPAGVLVAATLAGVATLNHAVTGDPLRFPHQHYDRTHGVEPVFLWQPVASRAAATVSTRDRDPAPTTEAPGGAGPRDDSRARAGGWRSPRTSGWHRLAVTLYFFAGVAGVLALLLTPALLRDPWARFAAAVVLVVAIGHFLIYPWWPHYSAPALGALLVPVIHGHRHLYVARRPGAGSPRAFGRGLFAAALLVQLVVFLVQLPAHRADPTDPSRQRARLAWEFERRPGRHLLLVRYPPGRGSDWTYNPADVDAAKVVWANDLGPERNEEILRYYPDRTAWRIDAAFTATDPVPELLRPARGAAAASAPSR